MTLDGFIKLLDVMTKIGLIIGGILAYYQYSEGLYLNRVERTFDFVMPLNQGDGANAYEAISDELRSQSSEINRINNSAMTPKAADSVHSAIANSILKNSRGGRGLVKELNIQLDIFEQIQVCIETNLCDTDTAHAFAGERSRVIWSNFYPYIVERRESISGYGTGIERFVGTEKRTHPPYHR